MAVLFSHGTTDSCGVCTLFKPSLVFSIYKENIPGYDRFIIIDIEINNIVFTLLGIYGPNTDTPAFYTDIFEKINSFLCDSIVITEDFNCVFSLDLDLIGGQVRTNFKDRN